MTGDFEVVPKGGANSIIACKFVFSFALAPVYWVGVAVVCQSGPPLPCLERDAFVSVTTLVFFVSFLHLYRINFNVGFVFYYERMRVSDVDSDFFL